MYDADAEVKIPMTRRAVPGSALRGGEWRDELICDILVILHVAIVVKSQAFVAARDLDREKNY